MNVRYTQVERDYIAARLGHEPLAAIAAALGRTELGLEEYLKGRRHSAPAPPVRCARMAARRDGLSIPELARALGIGNGMVRRWIADGLLHPETRYERRKAIVILPHAAVRRLIMGGALIDTQAKPTGEWRAVARATERRWHATYISGPELVEVLGYARESLVWLKSRGLPEPAHRARAHRPNYYRRADVRAWLIDNPQYAGARARAALGLPKE